MSYALDIIKTTSAQHYADATALIVEYSKWLNIDLSFQNFDQEMASLPTMYNDKDGGLFVAYLDHQPAGVVGLRRFSTTDGEVKRMFVRESARGHGLGKLLLRTCIDTARALEYNTLKLDTADFMKSAIKLYTDEGFNEIAAYRHNPQEGARYFELLLTS